MAVFSIPAYTPVEGWERLPAGYSHQDVAAVAVDPAGRVYLFCRGEHPVLVYERDEGSIQTLAVIGSDGSGARSLPLPGGQTFAMSPSWQPLASG